MLGQLAEDCAHEAMAAVVQRLAEFRGESHFTTWAYAFAVNFALVAARRERWARIPLDHIHEGGEALASTGDDADHQSRMLHAGAVATIREATERHLTEKQQQALRAVVFEQVPLDEVARHWGSNRNAVYKLLHDARRKLKRHLLSRGLDVNGILDLFASAR